MKNILHCLLALAGVVSLINPAAAAISAYVSKFDQEAIEEAYNSGTVFYTDTFNATTVGNFSTYSTDRITYTSTGTPRFSANTQYGGNNEGNFLIVSPGATVTTTFDVPVNYFGLYITALDDGNVVRLYNGASLLYTFNAATLRGLLSAPTVTAVDSSVYQTSGYYGQPFSGLNNGEIYAYVSFFATDTPITSAVLSAGSLTFDTDNYSVRTDAPAVAGSMVAIPVPEPQTWSTLLASGGLLGWMLAGRRRQQV